jgi:hypothetical protein
MTFAFVKVGQPIAPSTLAPDAARSVTRRWQRREQLKSHQHFCVILCVICHLSFISTLAYNGGVRLGTVNN